MTATDRVIRWSEQQLLDNTIDLASRCRWAVHHCRPARTARGYRTPIQGHKGFPDLVLARDGLVLFRELKGYDARGRLGRVSPEQRDWGRQLLGAFGGEIARGHDGYHRELLTFDVWTPDDWDALIVPTLRARTRHLAAVEDLGSGQ